MNCLLISKLIKLLLLSHFIYNKIQFHLIIKYNNVFITNFGPREKGIQGIEG